MRSRDSDKHADGTIESLRTLVNTIKEYALPEYPPNELGQVHFLRVVFESVIAEVEASIARQETDKETADANTKYIAAIPALCRGEEVPCALHVSQPITTLTRERDEARRECEELKTVVKIATDALNVSACWSEGPEVDASFDSPGDAAIARSALKKIKELTNAAN